MPEKVTPARLGRYEIERELGKGAMGVVYLARDPVIGRLVAIKTFSGVGFASELDEHRAHRRFIREAESAGALSHPNIVTIYDVVDQGAHGETFIAMEYVEGPNLAQWLASRRVVEFGELAEILLQAADGIDYAHRMGVVHRDIKPANLLIAAGLRVKIADFGIAKLTTSHLTLEPDVFGTPNYMPPEVMEGLPPDARSDIYALGVVAYELLTGASPFAAATLAGVVLKVVRGEWVEPEALVAGLPRGTGEVLARAMHRDPAERYATARDFADDLRSVLAGSGRQSGALPIARPLAGPTRRLDDLPTGRRPRRWAAAAWRLLMLNLVLAALFLGAVVWLRYAARPMAFEPGERAREQYLQAIHEGQARRADGDLAGAAAEFARAQALYPLGAGAARLRAEAEQAVREGELALRREAVRAALAGSDYPAALAEARRLIELGPDEVDTSDLLLAVEQGLAKESTSEPPAALRRAPSMARPAAAAAIAPSVAAPVTAQPPLWTTVEIALDSELEDGVLMVYAGDEQILRMKLADFRRQAAANPSRALLRFLPPRRVAFRVYAAVGRQPARLATAEADLASGERRRLRIRLPRGGERVRADFE